jgi:hypothetical protein
VRVYKPRAGKAHGNKHRFNKALLVWMREQCPQLLKDFGYYDLFDPLAEGTLEVTNDWIQDHNKKALEKSIANSQEKEKDKIFSLNINARRLLLRPCSVWFPEGRMSAK